MTVLPTSRVVLALACALTFVPCLAPPAAHAQDIQTVRPPVVDPPETGTLATEPPQVDVAPAAPVAPDTKGALVFHGNYCGPGSKGPGLPPVDALDEACMHHDACSPPVGQGLPSCACNTRLKREAALVARSPGIPEDERAAANLVAEGAVVLACRLGE